jgi:hypothetical protein
MPEVAIRQRLTVSSVHFFGHQISKIARFFVHRTPRGLMACTWPSRQVAAASCHIRGKSGRMPLLLAPRQFFIARLALPILEGEPTLLASARLLKSYWLKQMRPKLADQVAKNN